MDTLGPLLGCLWFMILGMVQLLDPNLRTELFDKGDSQLQWFPKAGGQETQASSVLR